MAASDTMYKDSPKIERGEDGKPKMSRAKPDEKGREADNANAAEGSAAYHPTERRETNARHMNEARALHNRHETEHEQGKGEKKDMHRRHEKDLAEMHDRHLAEVKKMHARQEKKDA